MHVDAILRMSKMFTHGLPPPSYNIYCSPKATRTQLDGNPRKRKLKLLPPVCFDSL
jgi:hypothetical protein